MIFKTTRQRLSRITGGVSCFLFYLIQKKSGWKWQNVFTCSAWERHEQSQPSAAATLTHLQKWTWVSGREFHQLLQYSEIWQRFTGASKIHWAEHQVTVFQFKMLGWCEVHKSSCVRVMMFVYIYVHVCVCVCVSPCCLEVEGLSLRLKCLMRQHRRRVYFSASGQKKEAVTKRSEEEDRRF